MADSIVMGVDGGNSTSRVVLADTKGKSIGIRQIRSCKYRWCGCRIGPRIIFVKRFMLLGWMQGKALNRSTLRFGVWQELCLTQTAI